MLQKAHELWTRAALVAAVGLAVGVGSAAAQGSRNADVEKLIALERMWNQAQVIRDSAGVASMIGDRFIDTEYDG
jgi:hypothetical protein